MWFLHKILSTYLSFWIVCCFAEHRPPQRNSESSQSLEEVFMKLFSQRRTEQINAVKGILRYDEKKREIMVNTVTEKIFQVIKSSRAVLEGAGYVPGLSEFPENEKTRDALSNILENTSLFGDMVLYIPDVTSSILSTHNEYEVLLKWSLLFMNQTQLLDKKTIKQMSLVSQELNITDRNPDYINPYKKSAQKIQAQAQREALEPKPKKKKKKKLPRGPRLTDEL
uniref:Coiled-coil domain-containing protein 134 n=1 Tax=Cacopsylla melanoneura TaxID=428564 RepID=A0A8D8SCB7_9HEMI